MLTRYLFYFRNIKRCRLLILFMAVQYLLAFLILHASVESIYVLSKKNSYVSQDDKADIYWLNGVVSSYVKENDKEDFLNFVYSLEENPAIEKVGFSKEGSAIIEDDIYITPLISMDEVFGAWNYRLSEGGWLDFTVQETQFILGGEAKRDYQTGDWITIQIPNQADGQMVSYESCPGRIVGFLEEPAYIVDLDYAASMPEFDNMLKSYDSVILTNNEELLEKQNWNYSNASLLVKPADGLADEAIDYLQEYGGCVSFLQIKQNSKGTFQTEILQMLPLNLVILLAVIYGFVGTEYMFIHRSRKALSVYRLCGQTSAGQRECVLAVNVLPMAAGAVMSFLMFSLSSVKETFCVIDIWTWYHISSSVLLILFLFTVICIDTNLMLKRTIISALYRSE